MLNVLMLSVIILRALMLSVIVTKISLVTNTLAYCYAVASINAKYVL
jgi:hypothetical protein